ncbi:MAG: hypothetical protein H6Q73_4045 [Firmicutes bacterium]|nr:hypothetical protein [Bacillota bacterium]
MEVLRQNPYVGKISETTITYTTENREKFAEEYNSGKPPSLILSKMAIICVQSVIRSGFCS